MKKGRKVCHLLDRRETIQVGQQSKKMSRRPEEATARVKVCRASEGTRTLGKSPMQQDEFVDLPRSKT